MCGRASLTMPIEDIAEALSVPPVVAGTPVPGPPPRYNLAPGQSLLVLRTPASGSGRELAYARWGLVPSWSRDASLGHRCIQARSETVASAPAYRDAFRSRRCVVVVDGFYEWSHPEGAKGRPHRVARQGRGILPLAGLWERWAAPDGPIIETCAVLTAPAGPRIRALHDRMPLVLRDEELEPWLHGSREDAVAITRAPAGRDGDLVVVPVSARVNDVRHDDPACIAPCDQDAAEPPSATRSQLELFR